MANLRLGSILLLVCLKAPYKPTFSLIIFIKNLAVILNCKFSGDTSLFPTVGKPETATSNLKNVLKKKRVSLLIGN